jgi:RNA polymerase sigma factor (sigma-70 family)
MVERGSIHFPSKDGMNNKLEHQQDWIESMVARYERPLCQYAFRITGDPDRARDAVQETFLRLCRTDREQVENHVAAWLFRVCRSRALDILRKEHRMNPLEETATADLPADERTPAEQTQWKDGASHLLKALSTLPPRQEEVIRLKFQQHMSYREIADALNLSESNVGFLIHTGIQTLRNHLST